MKHEVTTYLTKKTLSNELKNIMRKKPFSKVTVTEIIESCGLNRKTFYYHFEDKYALLKWTLEEEAVVVVKQFDLLNDYEQAIRFVMGYIEENDYFLSCIYDASGREEMKSFIYNGLIGMAATVIDSAEQELEVQLDPELKQCAAEFYTEAMAGMLLNWAKDRKRKDKEKTIAFLTSIIGSAIDSIKGITEKTTGCP